MVLTAVGGAYFLQNGGAQFLCGKLVFADDPHPLCLVQFFYLRPSLVITVPVWVFTIVIPLPLEFQLQLVTPDFT